MRELQEGAATRTAMPSGNPRVGERYYLLVLEGDSSALFHLPANGVTLIGRSPEVDLRLSDPTASRRHAKLIVADGEARLCDLESHNGTRVNGERIAGTRTLSSGDVITICGASLVLHAGNRPPPPRTLLDFGQLRARLGEEIQRALDYERPLTVMAIALRGLSADRSGLDHAMADHLRLMDVAGWSADLSLLVLLPEYGAEEARAAVAPLLEALAPLAPEVSAGYATVPDDGCDSETLLQSARAAAFGANGGDAASAGESATRIQLADRTVIVADPAMLRLYGLLRRLAGSDLPVLVSGETGAGKENAAFAVHHGSVRSARPFVTLNCAAIQESLVESELFGHERGAFTGATATKMGLLESANGGTVFFDEIGELPLGVQAKLLRALEARRITRLGDLKERVIDIRVVAATNRNLEEEVRAGRFRQDLYFRLSAATVILPPLRERPREIPILARTFLGQACARLGRSEMHLSAAAMAILTRYQWEGNVRELRNAMEYAAASVTGVTVEPWHLPDRVTAGTGPLPPGEPIAEPQADPALPAASFRKLADELRELERRRMGEALTATGGVQTRAAELIGMPLRTFVLKLKQHGLSARAPRREQGGE